MLRFGDGLVRFLLATVVLALGVTIAILMAGWLIILFFVERTAGFLSLISSEGLASILLSALAIALVLYVEYLKHPIIAFLGWDDQPGDPSKPIWYHIKVQSRPISGPLGRFFSRDIGLSCHARVDFLDKSDFERGVETRLVPQVTAHWTSRPRPLIPQVVRTPAPPRILIPGYAIPTGQPHVEYRLIHVFDESRVPESQRSEIGFSEEAMDIVVNFPKDGCFAADPWLVYNYFLEPNPWTSPGLVKYHDEWERRRVTARECVVKIEVLAINHLAKRAIGVYVLSISGPGSNEATLERIG